MKKEVSKILNKLASELPYVYSPEIDYVLMTGYELNLSALGELITYPKENIYEVPVPKYVAVEHKQQMKDAYKKGGFDGVKKYMAQVLHKIKNDEWIIIQNRILT